MSDRPTLFPLPTVLLLASALCGQRNLHLDMAPFQPEGRQGHGATFDVARGQMVVFGGANARGALADTLLNAGTWSRASPNPAPPARWGCQMAYDPDARLCRLFGGTDGQLWSWNGTAWSSDTRQGPLARTGHAFARDSVRKKLVVHGGRTVDFGGAWNDTWEFDASTGWASKQCNDPPPGRTGAAMVDVPICGGVLMFGGVLQNGAYTSQAFVWNGQFWNDVGKGGGPSKRAELAMCFDTDLKVIVVFGGYDGAHVLGDLYCGYGLQWIDRSAVAGPKPAPRRGATLVYDAKVKRCVLFGGLDASSQYPNDVWEWDNNTQQWSQRSAAPAPVVPQKPALPPHRGG